MSFLVPGEVGTPCETVQCVQFGIQNVDMSVASAYEKHHPLETNIKKYL